MLLSSGLIAAPCGVPCSGVHSRAPSRTLWPRNAPTSASTRRSGTLPATSASRRSFGIVSKHALGPVPRVALEVGIHHMHVPGPQQLIHPSKGILAAKVGTEAVALRGKLPLEACH